MRKSPTIAPRICKMCGETYTPMGNTQQYCEKCKKIRKRERGQAYFYRKNPDAKPKEKCTEPCCICGASFASYFEKKPYCNKHWQSVYRYGTPFGKQREKTCKFIKEQDVLKIITKQGDIILADKQDAPLLTPHSWCVSKTGYAVARINKKNCKNAPTYFGPSTRRRKRC